MSRLEPTNEASAMQKEISTIAEQGGGTTKVEQLIQQYCPDGVEYKRLGDVCLMERGTSATKGTMQEGDIPVISGGRQPAFYCSQSNREGKTITVAGSGAGAGYVQYWDKPIFVCDAFSIKGNDSLNTKFIYYFLSSIQEKIYATKKGGGVPHVHISSIDKFEIPVPPLPVQEEIVRILDTLTELQTELQKRKQQYEYYRDKLLSFSDLGNRGGRNVSVEWKKLGDVATIKTGRRFVRTDIRESGVPCFHYGDLYTYYGLTAIQTKGYLDAELASKLRFAQPNDVVVVCAGENDMDIGVGVAWLGNEPAVVHDACCILHHNQNPRYISHFLRTHNYHLQMKKYVKNGKISSLPSSGLANALIPIPSLEEQERIATILDKFYSLTTDITAGLPAEIEARRKQYEYYRDKLLTFKKK